LPTSFNTSERRRLRRWWEPAGRQIARTVFITVSTIEQYLTRVYRKLDVDRRTDLPAEFRLTFGAKRCPHQCLTQPGSWPVVAS
jgi:hypothetical protein